MFMLQMSNLFLLEISDTPSELNSRLLTLPELEVHRPYTAKAIIVRQHCTSHSIDHYVTVSPKVDQRDGQVCCT